MLDLTIAISTIRDPEQYLRPTLDEIYRSNKDGYKYEILVYSPPECMLEHSEMPQFLIENYRHGSIYGYNYLATVARGRNIAFLTDDMIVPPNFFDIVPFMDADKSSMNIHGFGMHDGQDYSPFPNRLILPNMGWITESVQPILNSVMISYGLDYASIPIPLIRFIAASKKTIDNKMNGYLFHPAFRNGGGDQWLSIWSWYHGKRLYEDLPVKLYPRGYSPSVLGNTNPDGETLRDLVYKLSLGYTSYV